MTQSVSLSLPMPPSVNSSNATIWVVDKVRKVVFPKRIKSKRGNNWVKEAGWMLNLQRPPQFKKPVYIDVLLYGGQSKRRSDADNKLKALLDLLKTHRVIIDDSRDFVKKVSVEWADPSEENACVVTVREAS